MQWCCTLLIVLLIPVGFIFAQEQDSPYLEIRGEVLHISGKGIPFANVITLSQGQGTATDYYGKFRFFAKAGDTLRVSAVGFQTSDLPIPSDLQPGIYPVRIKLQADTIELSETIITPWPESWEEFKLAFVELNIPEEAASIEISEKALKQAIRDARPEGGITMPGPVSLLYEAFSRDAKKRRKLEALTGENRRYEMVIKRLGENNLASICGSKERDLMESFVARCMLTDQFLASADELELIIALQRCAQKDESKNPNKHDHENPN